MKFIAIVTAHDQDPRKILGNLLYQTRKPDEIVLLCSGDCGDLPRLREDFPTIRAYPVEDRQDWGHEKRAAGVGYAYALDIDALGFFNADDSYDRRYVERMMAAIEDGADAVYCAWNRIQSCVFALGSSTSGNFVVRTELAYRVGYRDRHYEADGTFIEGVRGLAGRVDRIDDLLYFHNVQ